MIAAVKRDEYRQEAVAALNLTGRSSFVQLIEHLARIYVAPIVGAWDGLRGRTDLAAQLPTRK